MSTAPEPSAAAVDFLGRPHRLLVGGEWVDGGAEPIAVENPARETELTSVDAASPGDLDAAVAARRALDGPWGRMSGRDRAQILLRFADLLDADAERVAEVMTLEGGFPVASSTLVVRRLAADLFRYYAGWATKITGDAFVPSFGGVRGESDFVVATLKEPIGVVGAIVLWNAPAGMIALKAAPALATGCTMVLKTAELAPLTGELLAGLMRFSDEKQLLADVNSTPYGLSGSVWTRDVQRALRVARGIDSGQVGVNVHAAVSPETPFGGNRQSGWGREVGEEGLAPYLKTKAISINLGLPV